MNVWTYIRLSRSDPPGKAGDSDARRLTYSAALQQSEELLAAARTSGVASRPLPLFYALSQAGRAIAAALAEDDWQLYGHGLKLSIESDAMSSAIKPTESGSFPRIAKLLGCSLTGAATLEEVWAAIPALADTPGPTTRPRSLYVEAIDEEYPWSATAGVVQAAVVFPVDVESENRHDELLANYPAARDASATMQVVSTGQGYGRVVRWALQAATAQDRLTSLDRLVTFDNGTKARWLVPGVGESKDRLDPLLHWWLLLYGFSMLARYEPGPWRQLLEVDSSPWAVAVESALEIAMDVVPDLVLDALSAGR